MPANACGGDNMASENSVAVWNRLPPISASETSVRTASSLHRRSSTDNARPTEQVSILTPMHTHMQTIEGKRAMLIMDSCITKVLLVASFPRIVADIKTYELLLGREVVLLFKEYEMVADAYEIGMKTPIRGTRTSKRIQMAHLGLYVVRESERTSFKSCYTPHSLTMCLYY